MPKKVDRQELQQRFDNHRLMSMVQLEELFPNKKIDEFQFNFLKKGYRHVTTFDIEAINFDARLGFVICWYAKRWDVLTGKTKMIHDELNPSDMKKGYKSKSFDFDKRILVSLMTELKSADIVTGHYISKYDIPYVTARNDLVGQSEINPEYNDFKLMDTWRIMKQKYNAYNSGGNSLRNAGFIINGHDDKTSVDLSIWKTMYYVSHPDWKKCLKYITSHCKIDVEQNYKIFQKLSKRVPIGGASV
jgi:hypothetical protein